jgi:hypothetical protein
MKLGSFLGGTQTSSAGFAPVRSLRVAGLTIAVSLAAACASLPQQPVREQLDPQTATTVTVLDRPVELVAEASYGPAKDPFAYLAPFETDWMGKHRLFLWVTTPERGGSGIQPQVLCDNHPVSLQPLEGDLAQLKLSQAPYAPPAPWSGQWYFLLSPEGLKCLAGAQVIALETETPQGEHRRFTADRKSLSSLEAFSSR